MDVLTRERAKPALPFAGIYQLLDFPLSNLTHSGVTDVWLSLQFQGTTLQDEVANGRPWDLDRNLGGLRLLMPHEGTGGLDEEGFARGNADELFRLRDQVTVFDPDVLLVMSADHVYRLDYQDLLDTHARTGAECTLVTTEVPVERRRRPRRRRARRRGAGDRVRLQAGRPRRAARSPPRSSPTTRTSCGRSSRSCTGSSARTRDDADTGLEDFGDHLVPRLVERGRTFVHPMEGYWRDLGQPHLYLRAHQDVLTDDVGVLGEPRWPILSRQPQRVPARILDGATVDDSLVSPGCRIEGVVRRSVLGPGVVVEPGAEVVDSVVFADARISAGAAVHWTIVDTRCEVGPGAQRGRPGCARRRRLRRGDHPRHGLPGRPRHPRTGW